MTFNRRGFLASTGATMAAATGFFSHSASAAESEPSKSPNEQPVLGYIGTGIRFHTALGGGGTKFGPCARICDVDSVQAGRALQKMMDSHRDHKYPLNTRVHEDYRHALDDKNIDIVIIASPDHWHTKHLVEALNAGKDVYCEKPLTLTIEEGNLIEAAIKKSGGIVQVGTQQRTEFDSRFVTAAALCETIVPVTLRKSRSALADRAKRCTCLSPIRRSR